MYANCECSASFFVRIVSVFVDKMLNKNVEMIAWLYANQND